MNIMLEQTGCEICHQYALCYRALIRESGDERSSRKDVCAKCAHELGRKQEVIIVIVTFDVSSSEAVSFQLLSHQQRLELEL